MEDTELWGKPARKDLKRLYLGPLWLRVRTGR